MLRALSRLVIFVAILFSACSRNTVAPKIQPPSVAVALARMGSGENQDQIVLVPRAALVNVDESAHSATIYVVQGDRAMRRSVAVGALSEDYVEIASGIVAGEEVVTRGASNLHEGDRVLTVSRSGT
jgi:hypothetical protein